MHKFLLQVLISVEKVCEGFLEQNWGLFFKNTQNWLENTQIIVFRLHTIFFPSWKWGQQHFFFVLCERESLVIRRKQGGRNISIYKWHRKSLFVVYSLIATSTVVQKISCPRVEKQLPCFVGRAQKWGYSKGANRSLIKKFFIGFLKTSDDCEEKRKVWGPLFSFFFFFGWRWWLIE